MVAEQNSVFSPTQPTTTRDQQEGNICFLEKKRNKREKRENASK